MALGQNILLQPIPRRFQAGLCPVARSIAAQRDPGFGAKASRIETIPWRNANYQSLGDRNDGELQRVVAVESMGVKEAANWDGLFSNPQPNYIDDHGYQSGEAADHRRDLHQHRQGNRRNYCSAPPKELVGFLIDAELIELILTDCPSHHCYLPDKASRTADTKEHPPRAD